MLASLFIFVVVISKTPKKKRLDTPFEILAVIFLTVKSALLLVVIYSFLWLIRSSIRIWFFYSWSLLPKLNLPSLVGFYFWYLAIGQLPATK